MVARVPFRMRRKNTSLHHKFGSLGDMEGEFSEPSWVAVTSDSNIIVADANNHRVQVFDQDGRFKFQFGQVGRSDRHICYPSRVAVPPVGHLVIVDCRVTRVVIFDQSGNLLRKFVCSDQLTFPNGGR
ncbi:uncharacterized protein LOC144141549 [Haemaphysalis longicornis]